MNLLHIYCGDGKGKTTAALGLALRATGAGMKVHIVQFLKGTDTAELAAIAKLDLITIDRCDRNYGFTFSMSGEDKSALIRCHNKMIMRARDKMDAGEIDMLILDEWNAAYQDGLLDTRLADDLVLHRNPEVEMILTGRNPQKKFLEIADYVSEIRMLKHPYEKGIPARKGIEF